MIHAYLLAVLGFASNPAIPTVPSTWVAKAPAEAEAQFAPVAAGLSALPANKCIFTTAVNPHASLTQDGDGDQDDTDCVLTGAFQVHRFPGPQVEKLSMHTETITCSDETTRKKITWTKTTTDMMDVITVRERYSPSGQHSCEPISEHEVDPRVVSIETWIQYPDGHCTGDGDECCVPISSETFRAPNTDYEIDWAIPPFPGTAPYTCPNGEVSEADYIISYPYTLYDLVTKTTYLRIGDCSDEELCEPKVTDITTVYYIDEVWELESTNCE